MKPARTPAPSRSAEQGFSLLEVAFALAIIGIFVGSALAAYNVYIVKRRDIDTKAHVLTVESALYRFVIKQGRYPLPADRDIPIATVGFGREVAPAAVTTSCTVATNKVCRTPGADPVLFGDVPFATLGIHYSNALDMYGNKLTYAVTEALTATGTFSDTGGKIQILNRAGANMYGGASRSHYFVFSPGEDHQGAYDLQGNMNVPCGNLGTNGVDTENCDGDNLLRVNLDQNIASDSYNKIVRLYAPGATQFDDWGGYKSSLSIGMWATNAGTGELANTNTGLNVLIGTPVFYNCGTLVAPKNCVQLPKTRVEVQGIVRADTIRTRRMCYENNPGCTTAFVYNQRPNSILTPGNFAPVSPAASTAGAYDSTTGGQVGGGIICKDFRGMRGMKWGDELCNSSISGVLNPATFGNCDTAATGKYATGVNAAGQAQCN